jgi:hypothetical protein
MFTLLKSLHSRQVYLSEPVSFVVALIIAELFYMSAKGRPERELRPLGGSEAAELFNEAASVGVHQ